MMPKIVHKVIRHTPYVSRIGNYVDWRRRHLVLDSGGYTGDFKDIRRKIDSQIATPVDFATPEFEAPMVAYMYQLMRNHVPKTVVEIGVQRGCSTYAILQGLYDNDYGELHSIDMVPDIFFERLVAPVVPGHLKDRWHYHEGNSKIVLPKLLEKLGAVDIAFHDADHTRDGQFKELEMLWNHGAKVMVVDYDGQNLSSYLQYLKPIPQRFQHHFAGQGICDTGALFR